MAGAAALLSAVAKAKGIYSVASVAYELLENPIIVSDKSWKAIAIVANEKESDDKGFHEYLTQGVLSVESLSYDIKEKLTSRIEKSEKPFVYQSANMKYPRLCSRVMAGSKAVATVAVIELNRPFTEDDYETVEVLCNAISAEMQKNKSLHYTRGLAYEELIVELIENKDNDASSIGERAKALGVAIKDNIHVLTIDIKGFDAEYFSVTYMRDYLEKMLKGSKALIYGDNIVIVASGAIGNSLPDEYTEILRSFLGEHNMRGGVSRGFTRLEDMGEYYSQSLEALSIGTRMGGENRLYSYDDYAIYHVAKACSQTAPLQNYCHPKLDMLMKYDAGHNTTFASSLNAYLKHSRNITETAKALHLHRNSMIYHLHRIEEILGIALTDSNTLLHIELSFRFMEYDKTAFRNGKKGKK